MSLADAYTLLGLTPEDSPTAIKTRWRALALTEHPDHGGTGDHFRSLRKAYQAVLIEALTANCTACGGEGRKAVLRGWHRIYIACGTCRGSGKRNWGRPDA